MAPKLLMLQGLPGSGKTHFCTQFIQGTTVERVNKDDIRRELEKNGWEWSQENERDVIAIRDKRIAAAFEKGCDLVISDDTNFGKKHETRLRELAKQHHAEFEIKTFETPIAVCIERDSKREGKACVGAAVIQRMASQFLGHEPVIEPVVELGVVEAAMAHLPPAIICDLDGTLALHEGLRGPYEHDRCANDHLNVPIRKIVEVFTRLMGYHIIYMSGREDRFRPPTEEFLRKHTCPTGPLHMRATGDHRNDWIVKLELFNQHVRGKYQVVFVLDDRNRVVQMWRKLGLTCLQVADGDF